MTEKGRFTLAYGAIALLVLGCGGTALSSNDDSGDAGGGAGTCTLSHDGDVVVRTPAELELLREHYLVSGDLLVDCPACVTLEPLACLAEVGKMLSIVGCDQVESLEGLSALRRVGLRETNGGLGIGFYFVPWETSGNARLATLDGLGPLELVEGRIDVRKNPQLRDLSGLAGLEHVAGSVFLTDNDALPSLDDLRELRSMGGMLEVSDNDTLVDLSGLGSFVQARGLRIAGNDALVTLAGLDAFRGQFSDLQLEVSDNPLLGDVTAFENVQGTVRYVAFRDNASLREVSLNPALAILSGGLNVAGNDALERFEAHGLTHVAQTIQIEKNPLLATLELGKPISVGSVHLRENGALRDTTAFADVRVVTDSVVVEGNTALERLALPELQEVGHDLRIRANPALTGFELGALRRAERIEVTYNALVPSCLVDDLLAAVVTSLTPVACGNAPDGCVSDCPPPP